MARIRRRYVRQMPKIYGNLQPRHRTHSGWVVRYLSGLFWLGALLSLVYALFLSNWFSLRQVDVEGTLFTSENTIRSLVPLGRNTWLFPKDLLAEQILLDSRIQSVAIYRGLPDTLRIVVKERPPAALWLSGTTYSVLDDQGRAFTQYPQASLPPVTTPIGKILATLPRITDTKSLPVTSGKQVVTPTFIRFVGEMQKQLTTHLPELTTDHVEVADSTYDVSFIEKQGMRVQFNTLDDPGVQARNLMRLVHQKKVTMNAQVDLRTPRWAYVVQ